jgi:hypothetical protein
MWSKFSMEFDQRTAEAKVAPRSSNLSKACQFELRKNACNGDQRAAVSLSSPPGRPERIK